MSGGSADQGVQPRILTHRNLGPNSYSLNSVTLGRHLTYKNLGLLVFQKKKKPVPIVPNLKDFCNVAK